MPDMYKQHGIIGGETASTLSGPVKEDMSMQALARDLEFLSAENLRRIEHVKTVLFGGAASEGDNSDGPPVDTSIGATLRRIEVNLRDQRDMLEKVQNALASIN